MQELMAFLISISPDFGGGWFKRRLQIRVIDLLRQSAVSVDAKHDAIGVIIRCERDPTRPAAATPRAARPLRVSA
jgi:hypothetical protein